MSLFSTAHAAGAQGAANDGGMSFIIMLLGFGLVFYFLIWRPQNQRVKEQKELLSSLAKGDEVITNGGLLGSISKISDDYIQLSIADGVNITLQKTAVSATLPKGTLKSI